MTEARRMTPETEEFLTDLRAVYGEMFPHREPEALQYTDTLLAVGVLLRRELRLREERPSIPARFKLRGKILDGLAKYNPGDPE